MAKIAWADVVAVAGAGLAEVDPAMQMLALARVNGGGINPSVYGGEDSATMRLARIFMCAHFGTLVLQSVADGGMQGPVTSESVGADSTSFSYANWLSSSSEDSLKLTSWGIMFAGLAPGASLPYVVCSGRWGW